jgi:hypothetical protein
MHSLIACWFVVGRLAECGHTTRLYSSPGQFSGASHEFILAFRILHGIYVLIRGMGRV